MPEIQGAPVRVVNMSELANAVGSGGGGATPTPTATPAVSLPEYEDKRVFDGFGYTVSTAVVGVNAGNYLLAELANPANSGVNLVMSARVLSSNISGGAAPLEYARYASAATFPSGTPTAVTVNNRIAGGAVSPATFRFMMGGALPSGTVTSSGFIPTNGQEKRIKDIVLIAPGQKLIYAVGGAGGGLAASARVAMTFLFYTIPVA